ncbi:hypothetical protein D3C76_1823550 [compost metagenome]
MIGAQLCVKCGKFVITERLFATTIAVLEAVALRRFSVEAENCARVLSRCVFAVDAGAVQHQVLHRASVADMRGR